MGGHLTAAQREGRPVRGGIDSAGCSVLVMTYRKTTTLISMNGSIDVVAVVAVVLVVVRSDLEVIMSSCTVLLSALDKFVRLVGQEHL